MSWWAPSMCSLSILDCRMLSYLCIHDFEASLMGEGHRHLASILFPCHHSLPSLPKWGKTRHVWERCWFSKMKFQWTMDGVLSKKCVATKKGNFKLFMWMRYATIPTHRSMKTACCMQLSRYQQIGVWTDQYEVSLGHNLVLRTHVGSSTIITWSVLRWWA